jgi:hypothetical protein
LPKSVGEFSDKTFYEQIYDLKDDKNLHKTREYQDLKQLLLTSDLVDDVFHERELKRIFEPEKLQKPDRSKKWKRSVLPKGSPEMC